VLTTRGYGYADTGGDGGDPRPVDPRETLFRVGSVSKLATATAVLQLVEQGEVDLDADVQTYLDITLPASFERDVTLRHLLTHTAGYEERLGHLMLAEGAEDDLRAALATDPPEQVYEPGTVPAYSNYGMAVAGYVVERVSGMPFEEYVAEHVFAPAGMDASTFAQPLPEGLADRMSGGYATDADPAAPFEVIGVAPAGSMSATADDMARFMLAQLGQGPGADLLADDTRELMQAPALGPDTLGTLAEGPRMTLGYFDESRNGHRVIGHGGDTDYFHSHLQIYPEEGAGIFVTLNGSGRGDADAHVLRDTLTSAFADRYFPVEGDGAADTAVEPTAAEHAAMAEGTYGASRSMHSNFLAVIGLLDTTTVTARGDGTILVSPAPAWPYPLVYEEVAPWVWQEVGGQRVVTMRVEDGEVRALGFSSAFALLRVDPERDPAVAVPILVSSAAVLLAALLVWPVRAIVRRRLSLPTPPAAGATGRWVRISTRVAAVSAVAALAGWAGVIVTLMGLTDVPFAAIRALQALQLVGVLGILPAAAHVVIGVRRRVGWVRSTGRALLLLAFLGVAWFAAAFNLLAPSVSY
jgi:CubicO group peptidase (beta-lactamase class C family)